MSSTEDQDKFVSPFEGAPYTTSVRGLDGALTFTVMPYEITADGQRWVDNLSGAAIFLLFVGTFALLVQHGPNGWIWLCALLTPLSLIVPVRKFFQNLFTRHATLVFTPETFSLKTGQNWKTYKRSLTHRFVLLPHDKAQLEQRRRELRIRQAQKKGQVIEPKRYYADAYHIVLQYMGHRHDLLEVYDKNRALAVLARLKACDEVMDNEAKMGDGEALGPEDQWGDQPGDLPD